MAKGPKPADLTGQRFGFLLVLGFSHLVGGKGYWACRCECGRVRYVRTCSLTGGHTCGCGHCSKVGQRCHLTHGLSATPEYNIWPRMIQRCHNPRNPGYHKYGGRGIRVCPAWHDFAVFIKDVGRRPGPGYSIDRINNDGAYEPGNVRWATRKGQARNRRSSAPLTLNGETLTQAGWAERAGIDPRILHSRLKKGWSPEHAVFTPVRRFRKRNKPTS